MMTPKIYLLVLLVLAGCNRNDAPVPSSTLQTIEQTSALIKLKMQKGESADLWAQDIHQALKASKTEPTKDNVCAVVAVIEQESGFKADPPVANIRQVLAKKIAKMKSNPVLSIGLDLRLSQAAKNGATFRENIAKISTERDFETWYGEFSAAKYAFAGLKMMNMDIDDLVSTAGSMQVSIDYAKSMASNLGQSSSHIREQVYSRSGGVLYGTAHLLNYPADYSSMYYRFADYNAGHYASRNAAFQKMIMALTSNKVMGTDGDLLSYKQGAAPSKTHDALVKLAKKQGHVFQENELMNDLKQEKNADFTKTGTYLWIADLHQKRFGAVLKEQTPNIILVSDKITRKLTTQWYADSIWKRFKSCVARS